MISPSVINSKMAKGDFENIKARHADLMRAMGGQQIIVANSNQKRAAEKQSADIVKADMQKHQMVADTTAAKNASDAALKAEELNIKRAALSAT